MTDSPHSLSSWVNRLPRWFVLTLIAPLVVLNGWVLLLLLNYFRSTLTALLLATLLAFLLDYPVQFLQKRGVQRFYAVVLVFLLTLGLLVTLAITLVPLILGQLELLLQNLPTLVDSGSNQLQAFQHWAVVRRLPINMTGIINRLESIAPDEIGSVSAQLPSLIFGAVGGVFELILVIALTLYLLLYGKAFWDGIFRWLPKSVSSEIRQSLRQNFQGYFVGQATVSLIQGTVLSLAFLVIQLPLFLLFGMGIGLLALIPFCDILGVFGVSFIAALSNVWLGLGVLGLCLVIDQIIDNAISPRILGRLVGLNPVWIILSLLIGAQIGGFIGIILAVPLASTVQDVLDHLYPEEKLS
ncbi:MAG: AI-2E family transporter [Synechococcales cyanobacterium C42_A2020_086]|nr:AI-2E family transporter [Synechococcales cyanobacterium M58_A2018_015]MBF2075379.1 AI-2E family transporter [Synechococcales cyanobacterium C42_A2020_086]